MFVVNSEHGLTVSHVVRDWNFRNLASLPMHNDSQPTYALSRLYRGWSTTHPQHLFCTCTKSHSIFKHPHVLTIIGEPYQHCQWSKTSNLDWAKCWCSRKLPSHTSLRISRRFQGCNNQWCFRAPERTPSSDDQQSQGPQEYLQQVDQCTIYLSSHRFINWLLL